MCPAKGATLSKGSLLYHPDLFSGDAQFRGYLVQCALERARPLWLFTVRRTTLRKDAREKAVARRADSVPVEPYGVWSVAQMFHGQIPLVFCRVRRKFSRPYAIRLGRSSRFATEQVETEQWTTVSERLRVCATGNARAIALLAKFLRKCRNAPAEASNFSFCETTADNVG